MKHSWKLILCLLLALMLLSSCGSKDENLPEFESVTQALLPTVNPNQVTQPTAEPDESESPEMSDPTNANSVVGIFDYNPYDVDISELTEDMILAEENYQAPEDSSFSYSVNDPSATLYPHAGASPIPLDPLDMPTPTPKPDLTFSYDTYTASTVGVKFEGPVNWAVDESQPGLIILSEPDAQVKDGQRCIITVSAEPVSSNYSEKDLTTYVKQRLDTLYSSDYQSWKPSLTATRYMMGANGVYANYTATTGEGVAIGGRIQYVCIDRILYGLEIVFPAGFKEDFIDVFGQIRTTMKLLH